MKAPILKHLWLATALLVAVSARAVPVTYELQGTLTTFRSSNLPDIGIGVGSPFSALITYDPELGDDLTPESATGGFYHATPALVSPLQVTIAGHSFLANPNQGLDLWVRNGAVDGDAFRMEFVNGIGIIDSPWDFERPATQSGFRVDLNDPAALALDSKRLDADLAAVGWPSGTFHLQGVDTDFLYRMDGEITSVSRVPEVLSSGATLAIVALLLGLVHRRHPLMPPGTNRTSGR
jgi:hypothetical protein